mmetsp:Transcript_21275/g.50589  ORF Transcript_21275/g.50589 Transcript_21275/m.50589 type:complete len:95 (-) Transcript_21275:250-534(-)
MPGGGGGGDRIRKIARRFIVRIANDDDWLGCGDNNDDGGGESDHDHDRAGPEAPNLRCRCPEPYEKENEDPGLCGACWADFFEGSLCKPLCIWF